MFDNLANSTGYRLQGKKSFERFSNLKYLLVRDRDFNLKGVILKNGLYKDH
jgi:hypothetical protein